MKKYFFIFRKGNDGWNYNRDSIAQTVSAIFDRIIRMVVSENVSIYLNASNPIVWLQKEDTRRIGSVSALLASCIICDFQSTMHFSFKMPFNSFGTFIHCRLSSVLLTTRMAQRLVFVHIASHHNIHYLFPVSFECWTRWRRNNCLKKKKRNSSILRPRKFSHSVSNCGPHDANQTVQRQKRERNKKKKKKK